MLKITAIDLEPFCDPEAGRYALGHPWGDGKYIYASDGKIVVRISDDGSAQPPAGKVPRMEEINRQIDSASQWQQWPGIETCETCGNSGAIITTCDRCKGTGMCKCGGKKTGCPACGGSGLDECPHCGNDCDCEECDGDGESFCEECDGDGECCYCEGGQQKKSCNCRTAIGSVFVARNYAAMAAGLPRAMWSLVSDREVAFAFDGGAGLIATLLTPNP